MAESKQYAPCSVKEIQTAHGSLFKQAFNAEQMIAWIAEHTNPNGWVNLCITQRKTPGKFGDTHCCWLDTWKPEKSRGEAPKAQELPTSSPVEEDMPPF